MPDLPAKPNLRRTDHHLLALYARLHCEDAAWSLALELSARLFPQTLQETIRRYRRPEDRCARILGKWLLLKALAALGCPDVSLEGLRKDSNGRPSMENCIFDFNVSHSGECVACVVATQERVGIDLEKVRAVRIEDFRDVFASDLWSRLQSDEAEPEVFFREWTRLEASRQTAAACKFQRILCKATEIRSSLRTAFGIYVKLRSTQAMSAMWLPR